MIIVYKVYFQLTYHNVILFNSLNLNDYSVKNRKQLKFWYNFRREQHHWIRERKTSWCTARYDQSTIKGRVPESKGFAHYGDNGCYIVFNLWKQEYFFFNSGYWVECKESIFTHILHICFFWFFITFIMFSKYFNA